MSFVPMLPSLISPPLDPVAFHMGSVHVRRFGLSYLAAFASGYRLLKRMSRIGRLRLTPTALSDLMVWLAVGVMTGGRLGWWLVHHRGEGAAEPWYEAVARWHGGMSFHGGLLGVSLALAAFAWRRRVSFLNPANWGALVTPVGLFFGRLANFVNAESCCSSGMRCSARSARATPPMWCRGRDC